jgi:Transposase DDE domain
MLDQHKKMRATHTETMRERIDSAEGKLAYGRRIATVEPVFANIRHNKRMNRFTLRGKTQSRWPMEALRLGAQH